MLFDDQWIRERCRLQAWWYVQERRIQSHLECDLFAEFVATYRCPLGDKISDIGEKYARLHCLPIRRFLLYYGATTSRFRFGPAESFNIPSQAVYSHFPKDVEWQLLDKPLTINQFENLPLTKSQFFKCGMDFRSQHHGVVHSKDGNLKMNLGFWKPDSFTYKLHTEDNKDQFQGVSLRYYVLQETVNNQINFFFRFPTAGVFYLTIFAQVSRRFYSNLFIYSRYIIVCKW